LFSTHENQGSYYAAPLACEISTAYVLSTSYCVLRRIDLSFFYHRFFCLRPVRDPGFFKTAEGGPVLFTPPSGRSASSRTTLGCASRLNKPSSILDPRSSLHLLYPQLSPSRAAPDNPKTTRSGKKILRISKKFPDPAFFPEIDTRVAVPRPAASAVPCPD